MNSRETIQEQISALADGELTVDHMPVVFAALNKAEGKGSWDAYHQIGDILRSDEMAFTLSPDFMASLSTRLATEPTVIAPAIVQARTERQRGSSDLTFASPSMRRFAIPGLAAAAVMLFAFIATPQMLVATKSGSQLSNGSAIVASANTITNSQEGVVLRDPQIDQYLLAHQRFSPSAYSIAQYARPAIFATDSNK